MLIKKALRVGSISLKNLNAANQKYVSWLNDNEINKYTESRFQTHNLDSTTYFIENNNSSKVSLLLGIFENNIHIGNVRSVFDWNHKTATMGIIIGEKSSQGKGVGSKSIELLTNYIFHELGIFKINAGLYESNLASFYAFKKAGYEIEYRKKSHVINHNGMREDVIVMVRYE